MATLTKNIAQAIADFDDIEAAIEESGIDVPYDTDTSEYGNKIRKIYSKGVADGQHALEPATETKLGGIIIGENLSVTSDGTTTVKTSNEISEENKLPAKSSDVYRYLDNSCLTNTEIETILNNFE